MRGGTRCARRCYVPGLRLAENDVPSSERFDQFAPIDDLDDLEEETLADSVELDDERTVIWSTPRRDEGNGGHVSRPRGRIGKYQLHARLARGAFGIVYAGYDPGLERRIAIKVLRSTHLANDDVVHRFLQEARATARISHPGIVTILDCGMVETARGSTAFIAMELLSGECLTRRLMRAGRLPAAEACEIARQIASALDAAHRVDVLHRDLKPDNIFLVPDPAMPSGERLKVLDFGLAKLGSAGGNTQIQIVLGTPRYMSPEQSRSAALADHRTDIYSLGCILFELVTGRTPFDGDARTQMDCHQRAASPRAAALVPELSPVLDQLITDMLAKDPRDRPQTMAAVQHALRLASEPLGDLSTAPAPPSDLDPVPTRRSSRSIIARPAPSLPPQSARSLPPQPALRLPLPPAPLTPAVAFPVPPQMATPLCPSALASMQITRPHTIVALASVEVPMSSLIRRPPSSVPELPAPQAGPGFDHTAGPVIQPAVAHARPSVALLAPSPVPRDTRRTARIRPVNEPRESRLCGSVPLVIGVALIAILTALALGATM